jgi:hypothetical protein
MLQNLKKFEIIIYYLHPFPLLLKCLGRLINELCLGVGVYKYIVICDMVL